MSEVGDAAVEFPILREEMHATGRTAVPDCQSMVGVSTLTLIEHDGLDVNEAVTVTPPVVFFVATILSEITQEALDWTAGVMTRTVAFESAFKSRSPVWS